MCQLLVGLKSNRTESRRLLHLSSEIRRFPGSADAHVAQIRNGSDSICRSTKSFSVGIKSTTGKGRCYAVPLLGEQSIE